jgi:CBS domain-containing protein
MDVGGTIDVILGQKNREVFSINPDATVFDAVEMMANKNVGALLVMQGEQLVGIVSERDYTRKVMLRGKRSRETKVSEIMSSDLTVARPNEPVEQCLRFMTEKRVRHLPVMEGDKVRGVISIGDLVKWIISAQSATIAHLESYIAGGYSG